MRLADVYDWVREYGYPVQRLTLARWRTQLPRSADIAATTLAFFDSRDTDGTSEPELGLGQVRAEHVMTGLRGSGIDCPPLDRDLVHRYLDHCVSTGSLPAPASETPPRVQRRRIAHRHGNPGTPPPDY